MIGETMAKTLRVSENPKGLQRESTESVDRCLPVAEQPGADGKLLHLAGDSLTTRRLDREHKLGDEVVSVLRGGLHELVAGGVLGEGAFDEKFVELDGRPLLDDADVEADWVGLDDGGRECGRAGASSDRAAASQAQGNSGGMRRTVVAP